MWRRMVQGSRKRKTTDRILQLPKKRSRLHQNRKQQKDLQLQAEENISTGSITLLNRSIKTSSFTSSVSLACGRSSNVSSNTLPSTSCSTLLQDELESKEIEVDLENKALQQISGSNFLAEKEILSEAVPSETSCLESVILKEAEAATSEQFSCSRDHILQVGNKENYFSQYVVYSDQFSPSAPQNERKMDDIAKSSVYAPEELSFCDSVFDAEIETAMSKLDRQMASPYNLSDVTPSFPYYSDSEKYSVSPFFSTKSDDFEDSPVRFPVDTCSSLTAEFEAKFCPWKDYASANIPYSKLAELWCRRTELTESRTEKDDMKDLEIPEEEDERTFENFKAREGKQALFWDNLWHSLNSSLTDSIGKQRLVMINWIMEYTASRELQWETLFLSANLMDRFLSKGTFRKESHLQVMGIASMTLAIRLEENQPTNCVKQETFRVANNVFKRREVVAMEWLVLKVLDYRCFSPTVANFLWYYLKVAGGDVEVEKTAKYLACLSLVDRQLLRFWPSTIAASLVTLACKVLNQNVSYELLMEKCKKDHEEDLQQCVERMEWLLENVW